MILHGDCREVMATLEANSVDAIVSDPPYGLSFMGKGWDHGVPGVEFWVEALRVAKPGAHLLAFGGTRTYHRLACAIEDAGWEVRDCIAWVYGSGFPKSHDVSKAIDREAGAEREVVGVKENKGRVKAEGWGMSDGDGDPITAPATDAAKQWSGWGTALKPAYEPIIVARKPLVGTVASNVMQYGTGGINVDGCRVGTDGGTSRSGQADYPKNADGTEDRSESWARTGHGIVEINAGRWPANFIHDGSDEVVGRFPETKSGKPCGKRGASNHNVAYADVAVGSDLTGFGDSGSAARFFYCAKASKADRDAGCEGMEVKNRADQSAWLRKCNVCGDRFSDPATSKPHCGHDDFGWVEPTPRRNHHPTVKPTDLMRYLCRLVIPPGGTVLDPFCGSGSTGKGAILEGFNFIGIEREAEYVEIAKARTEWARKQYQPKLF